MSKTTKDLHKEAMAIFSKLSSPGNQVKSARVTVANYNDRRKKLTAELKPILAEMQEKFEADETIAGAGSMKDYCEAFKNYGCLTYRRVRQILTGESQTKDKVKSLHLTVQLSNVEFNSEEAYCVIDLEQKHEVKYTAGKRRSDSDFSLSEDNGGSSYSADSAEYKKLMKEDKIVWTHRVREIDGNVTVIVDNEDGTLTEEHLIKALREKMTATLKSMRLWNKSLTKEFNSYVKEVANWHDEKKENRSRAAKKGAANRVKKQPKTEPEISEPAKALAATMDNVSTDPRRHFPTEAERQQRDLFNACGNLDGDESEEVL